MTASMIERMSEKYWNAFRDGYIAVGGKPQDYPTWQQSTDPVKNETLRCLRHAVEVLFEEMRTDPYGSGMAQMEDLFPDPPQLRKHPKADHDDKFTTSMKIAEIGRANDA